MNNLIEVDDETTKGAQLISYVTKLRAPKKAVIVRKQKPLIDGEMGLPGPKPTQTQLEAWLEPKDDEEELPLDVAISAIKKKLTAKHKARK